MKKTICFYYFHINTIGGVETAILNLIAKLKEHYNIIVAYSYDNSSIDMLLKMSQHAEIVNILHKDIKADIVVYCSLYCQKGRIKAKKELRWVHGCIDDMEVKLPKEPFIENYIAVGTVCKEQLDKQAHKESVLIYNELNPKIIELSKEPIEVTRSKLNLVTVSRISPEKGFERMLKMSEMLKGIDYNWVIVGNGYNKAYENTIKKKAPKQWQFVGAKDNPFPYIKNADWLVQLSDYEAFGYVMLESKVLGTPVITTDYTSAFEMINKPDYGMIIKKDLSDFDVNSLFSEKKFNFEYKSNINKWLELFEDGKKR